MRIALAAAATALAFALESCGGSNAPRAPELLPDLDQVAPRGLSIVVEGERELLVFLSAVDNVGRGPLVVSARRTDLEPEMSALQVVRRANGESTAYPLRLRVRFVVSETHRHWHVLGFERYELRTLAGEALGDDRKTGFCLGDRYDTDAKTRIPGEPPRAVWVHNCGKDQPDRTRLIQGISPGFGDDYVPRLEGQFVDVTNLEAGRYVLVHRANPEGDIRESNYENNAASVLVALRRPAGKPPVAVVLATCQQTERCD
jgi:hypothetical protein